MKRWGPLRAWCRALRGRLSVAYTSEPDQHGLTTRSRFQSLVLTLDESEDAISPRERIKIRDALELVVLALQVAPQDAWEQVVRVLCWTQDFFPVNHLLSELEPRVSVRHVAYGTFQYDSVDVFECMFADPERSKSYHRTRRWILSNPPNQHNVKPVLMCLEFMPTIADMAQGSTRYLNRVTRLMAKLRDVRTSLRIEAVHLDLRALDVDEHGCQSLRELQQTGVRVDSLLFSPVIQTIASEGSAFQSMLDDCMNPLQRLVLDNSSGLAPPAIWMALRHARSLKEVEIVQSLKGTDADRARIAQWQAFSLLDPRSPTSIEIVRFTEGSISQADIATMNEIVEDRDPTHLLGLPRARESESFSYREKRLKLLQIPTSPASDEEMTEILQLLGGVGRCLETLAWSVDRAEIKHNHLRALFAACPKLLRLRLQRAQLQEIDGLLAQYQAGRCRTLESLIFEDSVILDRPSLLRFLSACNDPRTLVHHTLKDFEYDNYLHESVLADLIPIIARNRTLRHIGIRVTAFGMARHRAQLKGLHLAPLSMRQAPLPIDSKIAFMSAALEHLNSDVCHQIFEFAGQGVRRKLVCLVYDWIRLPNRFEL